MIHQAAEPDREAGGEYQVDTADHAGDKYRARFQERPEHQREPDREIDHVLHQIISENQIEGVYPEHGVPILRTERSEEHTSELQSLMRISYAVFCLKKKTTHQIAIKHNHYLIVYYVHDTLFDDKQ